MLISRKRFRAFTASQSGQVAILTALLAVPVTGAIGLAVDYGRATYAKQQLDSAAAAAAATASNAARITLQQTGGSSDDQNSTAYTEGRTRASAAFTAHSVSNVAGASVSGAPTVTVSRSGSTITAQVQYSATISTTLGQLLGVRKINLSGQAAATATINTQTSSGSYLLQESFETNTGVMQYGNWGVYQNYNGWVTSGDGVEIDQNCTAACNTPDGSNSAELDSNSNSAMSRKFTLAVGQYELRYWYFSRVDNPVYDPVWICGSTDADVDWANDTSNGWGALTNKISVYFDRAASTSSANLSWSSTQNGYVGANLVDSCVWSGQKWIERSIKINVTSPGDYWLTFTALGANDSYGGLIDNIRLCVNTCPGTANENFPWAANTLLFKDDFTNSNPPFAYAQASTWFWTNVILDKSGNATGWTTPMAGWTTFPQDQMDWLQGISPPNGVTGHPIELAASQSSNPAITRRFLFDPGYYQFEYYYASRLLNASGMPSEVLCGSSTSAISNYSTIASNSYSGANLFGIWEGGTSGWSAQGNIGQMGLYIDADRLVSHPEPNAIWTFNTGVTFKDYKGNASSANQAPQNLIETCVYSPNGFTKRTVKFRIDKPGYYWITLRAEGPVVNKGASVGSIALYALGGLSATAPSGVVAIPEPAPALGASLSFGGMFIAAQ